MTQRIRMEAAVAYDDPCYTISIVARIVGVHQQTLRIYEREGLVAPLRSGGNRRLYSHRDVDRLLRMKGWIDELGVNVAGAFAMARLTERIDQLEAELDAMRSELVALRTGRKALPGNA
ncbi:MAG: MerR family transcriptional regulator [Chloroflexi bacterium]|nr:MerR family transcriptional regulator [Chloroflexota bacterium]